MDETTKVIIATISGFVIAFFAEPVKNYFENKAKLRNLKIALYKEILYNYGSLKSLELSTNSMPFIRYMGEFALRTECYKNAIQNEVSLFYQLEETNAINTLHNGYLNLMKDMRRGYGEQATDELIIEKFVELSNSYRERVAVEFYRGNLDKEVLKGLGTKNHYQNLIKQGKEILEKRPHYPISD
jgi:hypothetical protein